MGKEIFRHLYRDSLSEKLKESLGAVLPIVGIVLFLAVTIAPIPNSILLSFLFGGVLLVAGMTFFSLGAELAMEPMGQLMGSRLTKTRRVGLILGTGLLLGVLITVSEPDLQVLAHQVQSIPNAVLILSVAAGVGIFLVLALLRTLLGIPLRRLLLVFYGIVLLLALLAPADFLAVAFDSGGVTTGPMTVPFIMAFGIGISSIRNDKKASDDSFGLIALCSVGPILAVLILSLIFKPDSADYTPPSMPRAADSVEMARMFVRYFPEYLKEIAVSLLPITAMFGIFQVLLLRAPKRTLLRIFIGLVYTYAGLVLFLTGVNAGFMPAGLYLGETLAGLPSRFIVVPIGMLIGYFIVQAEPAVYVLMRQVEELTSGAVSGTALRRALSFGVSVSVGLAMFRVLTGLPILYLVVPGYLISLALSFAVPDMFTGIAFDSGGVASGPMTATFLLPFATGACLAMGGNVVTDAFGVVAMVAMTPLIAIQVLGVMSRQKKKAPEPALAGIEEKLDWLDDYEIIAL